MHRDPIGSDRIICSNVGKIDILFQLMSWTEFTRDFSYLFVYFWKLVCEISKLIGFSFNILEHCAPYLVAYYECRTHYAQCRFWPCARLIKETGFFSVRKPKLWTSFSLKKVQELLLVVTNLHILIDKE